jgi:twinkle protein
MEVAEVVFDENDRMKDVVYGIDVKDKALKLYHEGYEKVFGIGVPELDERFKPKRGELTLLTGIGNYGKSAFKKWYQVFRAIMYDEKFGGFTPEDNPPEEYYHDLVEILLGCDCTPTNPYRPSPDTYEYAYDFIIKHFFYVYPKEAEPTPKYIKEILLELIVKEKLDGCDVDPFNQMSNNYQGFGGRDKYLEFVLTDLSRFAVINNVYLWVIAHPTKLPKGGDGNYVCPDVFDINDGAMWNNKVDNLLVYHRPFAQTDPQNPACEFHSKKIRRQKTVGKKGSIIFEMRFSTRRFFFNNADPLGKFIYDNEIDFKNSTTGTPQINSNGFVDNSEIPDIPF